MAELDAGDLVVKRSPPELGGMDIYRKGANYCADPSDLQKVTFFNELGMRGLGRWIGRQLPVEKLAWAASCSKERRRHDARRHRKTAVFELGRRLIKSGDIPPDFQRALTPGYVAGSGTGGAVLGGGLGALLGLIEKKDDKEWRLTRILKRLLQGGAIGGVAGGMYGLGKSHGMRSTGS